MTTEAEYPFPYAVSMWLCLPSGEMDWMTVARCPTPGLAVMIARALVAAQETSMARVLEGDRVLWDSGDGAQTEVKRAIKRAPCVICGKMVQPGHAMGGHMRSHRTDPVLERLDNEDT
ncbi:MAG TPA: C2H2-type zinc finger protein [Ktedonobacterales bacterium]|nr:C2H2-type zinc finger protein [Ktedonobacterales bacterium]